MRAKVLLLVTLLVALSVQGAYASSCPRINIIMFGDSITQGLMRNAARIIYGRSTPGNGADLNASYAPALRANIVEYYGCNPNEVNIYNWGTGGDRTWDMLLKSRYISDWLIGKSQPGDLNFLMLMGGANDLYSSVQPSDTSTHLKLIIQQFKDRSSVPAAHIFLASITQNYIYPEINSMYNSKIRSLAVEQGVNFVDQYNIMQPWGAFNSGDGLHVNSLGYGFMADGFFNSLSPILGNYIRLKSNTAAPMVPIINFILEG